MSRPAADLPPLYATVQPGLEEIAGEEITRDAGGTGQEDRSRARRFSHPRHHPRLLEPAHRRGRLPPCLGHRRPLPTGRPTLKRSSGWTAHEPDWPRLLQLHHRVHPKPKGKPTYRLVAQMVGTHGYRRIDARTALARGLAGKLPASWRPADENAAVEVWLSIDGPQAVCGLRLSDATMRHRTYKDEHLPASLRPTVAAAMVPPGRGRGRRHRGRPDVCGGHHPGGTTRCLLASAGRVRPGHRRRHRSRCRSGRRRESANRRPRLAAGPVGRPLAAVGGARPSTGLFPTRRSACNSATPKRSSRFTAAIVAECDRVLRPGGGRCCSSASGARLQPAAAAVGWRPQRRLRSACWANRPS